MLIIGHRGALHEALENSTDSFAKAVDAGAARIELDVQLAKDGSVVIMHDDNLQRTCGVPKLISRMDRDELKATKLRNGEPLPFLDETLDRFLNDIEFNIEIKGNSVVLAEATAAIMRRHKREDKFVVSCFEPEPLEYFARTYPEVRRACLIGDYPKWPQLAARSPLLFMQKIHTNIIHPWAPLVDENFMDQAKARGWIVYPYCSAKGEEDEDQVGLWTTLKTLGIDGLCTNYPRQMRAWLEEITRHETIR